MVHLYQKPFQYVGNVTVALLSLKLCKRLEFRSRKLSLFRIYFIYSLQGVFSKPAGLQVSAEACCLEQDNLKTFPLKRNVV
jgi:predicted permease